MDSVGIVGGGLAGLTCAYRLAAAGVPTALYECSDRLGGRLSNTLGDPGPRFLGLGHVRTRALCREAGLDLQQVGTGSFELPEVVEVAGRRLSREEIRTLEEGFEAADELCEKTPIDSLDTGGYCCAQRWLVERGIPSLAADLFVDSGAESLAAWAMLSIRAAGGSFAALESWEIPDVYSLLAFLGAAAGTVELRCPVSGIHDNQGRLQIVTEAGHRDHRAVVVATPFSHAQRLMPKAGWGPLRRLRWTCNRLVSWPAAVPHSAILALTDGPIRLLWASRERERIYALVPQPNQERRLAVNELGLEACRLLSKTKFVLESDQGNDCDWSSVSWVGGAWPAWQPGTRPLRGRQVPDGATVFFAGDYLEPGFTGFMEGSVRSAERAADAALALWELR